MPAPQTEIIISIGDTVLDKRVISWGNYTIGSQDADIVIDEETIDAHHATLFLHPQNAFIEDLGSIHGTHVNDHRISKRVQMFSRQKIRLGTSVKLHIQRMAVEDDGEKSLPPEWAMLDRLFPEQFSPDHKFDVGELVGEGGMGSVYKIRELAIRRSVAMKVMNCEITEESLARFVEEAQITGQLEHPNITPVHEMGLDEFGRLYYTMKLIRGMTLRKVLGDLKDGNQATVAEFPLTRLLNIFEKVCDAVAFAHSKGVIHCDIKPDNIMIGTFGEVMLTDWGLARLLSRQKIPSFAKSENLDVSAISLRKPLENWGDERRIAGSAHYMSPEQARAENDALDQRSDIYSLGAILCHLLHLEKPFKGETPEEVLDNVRAGRIGPDLCSAEALEKTKYQRLPLPHIPGGKPPVSLLAVVGKAMRLTRSERYENVAALQEDLNAYQSGFAPSAERASTFKQLSLAVGRYKTACMIGLICFVLLAVGGTFAYWNISQVLAKLKSTAPKFATLAKTQIVQENFDEALDNISTAVNLVPADPDFLLQKGNLLESQMRFGEAVDAFREVRKNSSGPISEQAGKHEALCLKAHDSILKNGRPARELLKELLDLMTQENRSAAERKMIATALGEEGRLAYELWLQRLLALPISPESPISKRLGARDDGLLTLDLSHSDITDLSFIKGMPLAGLNLSNCPHIKDLSALTNISTLESVNISATDVRDLSPLEGLHLREIALQNTQVTDLTPLAGQPLKSVECSMTPVINFNPIVTDVLETLLIANTQVTDLAFLKGIALKVLRVDGCKDLTGLELLSDIPSLEVLVLPTDFYLWPIGNIQEIRKLKNHPGLERISANLKPETPVHLAGSKAEFWKLWEKDLSWIYPLRTMGLKPVLTHEANGTWNVNLRDQKITDISCLKDCRLNRLDLFDTLVSDLTPLAEQKELYALDLRLTAVTNLAPLAGLPIRELMLWRNQITDYSVFRSLTNLERLDLSETNFSDTRMLGSHKLQLLRLGSTRVMDLKPLEGMPLEKLHCDHIEVTDVSPLMNCKSLKWFVMPQAAKNYQVLRDHPSLEKLSYNWGAESEPDMTVEQFWSVHPKQTNEQ